MGSRGEGVRELQYLLRVISEFVETIPSIVVDGIFGERTEEAVRAFQNDYGIPVTGVVNTETWELIYRAYQGMQEALPPDYNTGVEPYPGFPLSRGQRGEEVTLLQNYLNFISDTYTEIPKLTVDGIFGAGTDRAVRTFQRLFDIRVTGIVGAATWNAIAQTYKELRREKFETN